MVLAAMIVAACTAMPVQPEKIVELSRPAAKSEAAFKPAWPHPMITEVLYDPPKGKEGDADKDGTRDATGDEFIELVNPHDKAINLKGYVLGDSEREAQKREEGAGTGEKSGGGGGAADDKTNPKSAPKPNAKAKRTGSEESRLKFVFPELTLKPGEVVVVFNGHESHTPGNVGDAQTPPSKGNDQFGGAYVLSMRNKSKFAALANATDCVVLTAPDGKKLECVVWGEGVKMPEGGVVERVSRGRGSVSRAFTDGAWSRELGAHEQMPGAMGEMPFSPGVVKMEVKAAGPEKK